VTDNCLFCKIARKEIPATVVYEDNHVLAFRDINPGAPVHILVIPRQHIESMATVEAGQAALIGHLLTAAAEIARAEKIAESGYRLVANTGKEGGQSVYHLHFHLMGGRQMSWPPG
jgi:histidine triad (HIT) family protein